MTLQAPRLQRELRTMACMVDIYCRDHHRAGRAELVCAECRDFLAYAERRLEKCPYGARKPTCARCPIHCYKPTQREHARTVMRYAGPRMTLRHPWLSLLHLLDKLRRVEHPIEIRRRQRDGRPGDYRGRGPFHGAAPEVRLRTEPGDPRIEG